MNQNRQAPQEVILRRFATVKQGYTFSPKFQGRSAGRWLWAKVSDMEAVGNEVYLRTASNHIDDGMLEELGLTPFEAGSVIFPRVGAALKTNKKRILDEPCLVDDNVLVVTVRDNDICLPKFLYYWFQSISLDRAFAHGGLVPSIPPRAVLNAKVPIPPIDVQQQIASILSTWDRAIEQTERLIAAKRRRKQALMQQLLTGKRRFSGEDVREWRYVKATDLFQNRSLKGHNTLPVLSVTQDQGVVLRSSLERKINMSDENTGGYKLVEPGDFVISLRSFQGGLEYSEVRGIVSPAYHVIHSKEELCPAFYRHFFKSSWFIGHLAVAVIGIRDGKQVSFDDFSSMKIPCPSPAEQRRIAGCLDCCDHEIDALRKKFEALKKQKKCLMQQLLTGKVRGEE